MSFNFSAIHTKDEIFLEVQSRLVKNDFWLKAMILPGHGVVFL